MSIPPETPTVKTRRYSSQRRRDQAARTRRDIVETARRLFEQNGYAATTMATIAAEAGVAVETIYKGFAGKAGLMQAVVEAAVAGGADRAERPVEERPAIKAVIEEADPRRKLELYAATQPGIHARAGPLMRALREAATLDDELAGVLASLESQRSEGILRFADHLAGAGALRPGLSPEEARDVVWTINSLAVHDLLVVDRGWPVDRYQEWIAAMMVASLLPEG